MLDHMKKRPIRKTVARFIGSPEAIRHLRRVAKAYNVTDITDVPDPAPNTDNFTIEDAFPEVLANRSGISIRGYRARGDLTQKQLADLTGIHQRHISEMENGKRTVGKEWAKKLAKALNCDYRALL
jgi:DNA-binding XRE family transcriptional regulator